MSVIAATPTAGVGAPIAGTVAKGNPASTASLLPLPHQGVGSIEALYALMAEASAQKQQSGKAEVDGKFKAKKAALDEQIAQLKKAAEDAKSGDLFKTLAKVGMVVAAVAATVATVGAAGPVVAAVAISLSASGFFVSETKCFGDEASKWIGTGLSLAGALVTCGAGTGTSVLAQNAQVVANGASGTSAVAQGCQTAEDALHKHAADLDTREATKAQQQMKRLQDAIEDVITSLQDDKQAKDRGSETVNQIIQTRGDTMLLAATGGRA